MGYPHRRRGWLIVREGDAAPEYFSGAVLPLADRWTRDPDRALAFYSRRVAEICLRDYVGRVDARHRIVPCFVPPEPA